MRIVLTGGPGGGKTTALDLFRRELPDKITVVPETATMIFKGGIPRFEEPDKVREVQKSIYRIQHETEELMHRLFPHHVTLCDRGSLDGAAYWPGSETDFFDYLETTLENELKRYDQVIFFETGALGGSAIRSNNIIRTESDQQAILLDTKLKKLWGQHPHFHCVPHHDSFIDKITYGLSCIRNIVNKSGVI